MDDRIILIKVITLAYREKLLENLTDTSNDLIKTILLGIVVPDNSAIPGSHNLLQALKETAQWVINTSEVDKDDLLQRLKLNCGTDIKTYEIIQDSIGKEMDEGSLKRTVVMFRKHLTDYWKELEAVKIIGKAYYKVKFERNQIDNFQNYLSDMQTSLEPFQFDSKAKDPAIVSSVNLGNTEEISMACTEAQAMNNESMILRCGWQGINDMLNGGFRRGLTYTINALAHNYKSGFSFSLFKQIAMYNKPVMKDVTKKPLLLRISFEDSNPLNFQFLYQNLYENEHKAYIDISTVDNNTMAKHITEKLGANGYHVILMHVKPSEWTYKSIINCVMNFEANGYEVHMLALDYLNKIDKAGCNTGVSGEDVRNLFERMVEFCKSKDILHITPHQLAATAKDLIRDGHQDFVTKLPGRGDYDRCRTLDQVIDGEIFIHIEKVDGVSYLDCQRGKHRIPGDVDDKLKRCALPFSKYGKIKGMIYDDINGEKISVSKPGMKKSSSNDEDEFWEASSLPFATAA